MPLTHLSSNLDLSQASRLAQDSKDKPTSLVIREICQPLGAQVPTSAPSHDTNPPEPPKADAGTATGQTQGIIVWKMYTLHQWCLMLAMEYHGQNWGDESDVMDGRSANSKKEQDFFFFKNEGWCNQESLKIS